MGAIMIDVHVHLAALPHGKNECFISERMLNGTLFRSFVKKMGLPVDDPEQTNELYIQRLVRLLKEGRYVRQAVILGMDGVYDAHGKLNKRETHILVSNRYVQAVANRFPEQFKAGVSINPQRQDALEELERCVTGGAVLVKMLPNSQQYNPANPQYRAFWRAMAKHKIPLLTHIGYEFSLWGKDQSVGDPSRLQAALEEGVTVIAAHGASFGLFFYEKYWKTLQDFVRRYPNFYWDASALSLPNRVGMLLRIRKHSELWPRMVFGTDYPLPSFAFPALLVGQWRNYLKLRDIHNSFDRHYRLLQMMGISIPEHTLGRSR